MPWLAVALHVLSAGNASSASPPGSVYGIIVSLFVLFDVFAVNRWPRYKRVGRWEDHLHGEQVCVPLSPVAESLLARQVSAGTLAPTG